MYLRWLLIVGNRNGQIACYMEKLCRIGKLEGEMCEDNLPDEMIINTEWGAFGDDGAMDSVLTEFDRQVDASSINPGKQLFEKMISGMYMGELVRVVLCSLAAEGLLFNGDCEAISHFGCFPTKFVSEIESDLLEGEEGAFLKTFQILEDIGIERVSNTDCANVAYTCSLVSTRLVSLIRILKKMCCNWEEPTNPE
ncbi:Hexokinase [Cooperia oncophora]